MIDSIKIACTSLLSCTRYFNLNAYDALSLFVFHSSNSANKENISSLILRQQRNESEYISGCIILVMLLKLKSFYNSLQVF